MRRAGSLSELASASDHNKFNGLAIRLCCMPHAEAHQVPTIGSGHTYRCKDHEQLGDTDEMFQFETPKEQKCFVAHTAFWVASTCEPEK